MTERVWIVDGKPVTLAQFKAQTAGAAQAASARFAKDWGGLSPEQTCRVAVDNAHLFKAA